MAITSSPITFIDLTDQQQLSAYLTSNLSTVQFRGADDETYTPSWEDTPLVITVNAFVNQQEIDYTSGEYTFVWSVKDNGVETVIQEGNKEANRSLAINSNKLGETDSGMLTYVCQIKHNDMDSITAEITYTLIGEGKSVVFSVYSQDGTIFRNQTGEITLETIKYYGQNEITSADTSFKWYKLTSDGEEEIIGATQDAYTVQGQDVVNIASYKCTMTYNGVDYSDVITLQDVSDNYTSDILTIGGTVFKNGIGGSAVYISVRANGQEQDGLAGAISVAEPEMKEGEYWYYIDNENDLIIKKQCQSGEWVEVNEIPQDLIYTWYLMDQDGNTTDFGNGKVVYMACDDIKGTVTLCCEVSTKDGKLLSISQETFIDLYDSYNVVITPDVATISCDNNGNIIYDIDDAGNILPLEYEFNYAVDIQNNVIDASCTIDNVDGLVIDATTPGVVKVSIKDGFNFSDSDDFSLKMLITTNDKQEFEFERYITFIKIKAGKGAVSFSIYTPEGDVFKEGVDEIELNAIGYCGDSVITDASYSWYYYLDNGEDDKWHQISQEREIVTQEEASGISDNEDVFEEEVGDESYVVTTSSLVVSKAANYAFLTLKCIMEYNGNTYEDYVVLKDYYNPYTATVKFLNESNVIGVEDSYVVAYVELYQNHVIVDGLPTTKFYYSANNKVANGVITPSTSFTPESDEDMRYFIGRTSTTIDDEVVYRYPVTLGKYDSSTKVWSVVQDSKSYIYKNTLYEDTDSKIILIPKRYVTDSKEITFTIYNSLLDNDGNQIYNDELLVATSNTIVVSLTDKLGDVVTVTNNVKEYMEFNPDSGLKISQKDDKGNTPFYVNITSKRMGFHQDDDEVVYISNNAANITNLTVEQSAEFNCKNNVDFNCEISVDRQIDIINTYSSKSSYPGFSFQIESDGSLSLVRLEVD